MASINLVAIKILLFSRLGGIEFPRRIIKHDAKVDYCDKLFGLSDLPFIPVGNLFPAIYAEYYSWQAHGKGLLPY